MDVKEEEVKVGVGDVEDENELLTPLIRIAQHNKPKKSYIAQVKPKGN
jgi:hypothetical protein